jgi:hypothetical protein
MSKFYYVEVKLNNKKWVLASSHTRHTDALHYVKENCGERYPMRIVRVVRTIVFNGEK